MFVAKLNASSNSSSSIEEVLSSFINGSYLSKNDNLTPALLCFLAFSWCIWKEQTQRFFRGKKRRGEGILKEILHLVRVGASFLSVDVSTDLASAWDLPLTN